MSAGTILDSIEGPRSSSETPVKYDDYRRLLSIYLTVTLEIMRKHAWAQPEYHYFDLNAGNGRNPDGTVGSPLIFREVADRVGLPFRAWLFEGHARTAAALSWSVAGDDRFTLVEGDHRQTVNGVAQKLGRRNVFGLIYADPNNGLLEPCAPVIGTLLAAMPANRVDVLWYGSGANVKRVAMATERARLLPQIEAIGKRYWFVREPRQKHQWTFWFGTNWDKAPEPGRSFGRLGTDLGDAYAAQLNETNSERRAKVSPPLPFLQPDPATPLTGAMPNTYGIPGSGLSARMRSRGPAGDASDAAPGQLRFTT